MHPVVSVLNNRLFIGSESRTAFKHYFLYQATTSQYHSCPVSSSYRSTPTYVLRR